MALPSLEGQVAVVTGGTRGLGRGIADGLALAGATVVTTGRSAPDTEHPHAFVPCDVTDPVSVAALVDTVVAEHSRLDLMVCNAGISRDGMVIKQPVAEWADVLMTNVVGSMACLQQAARVMKAAGTEGSIILISSCVANRVAIGASAYSASKAAVEMLARSASTELARYGIRVNCLSPGYVDAGMGATVQGNEKAWAEISPRLLSGRLARADEIAAVVGFLASSDSSYVNGHVLEANGGLMWA